MSQPDNHYGLSNRQIDQILRLNTDDLIARTVRDLDCVHTANAERTAAIWDTLRHTIVQVMNVVRDDLFTARKEHAWKPEVISNDAPARSK